MLTSKEFVVDLNINRNFKPAIAEYLKAWKVKPIVDILIVVENNIAIDPSDGFGITSVIALLRATKVGCMRFRVDIALRNNQPQSVTAAPGIHDPKYRGFRFDMANAGTAVIDKYEQIWCFGFKPSNSGSPNDAEIDTPAAMPATNAELAKLASWMAVRKGGVFGTGDHHFLGASMCRKIPRLGTMRRWTNASGVPPQGGPGRIDTLRPPSADYEPGHPGGPLALGNTDHQGDLTVQPIRWVAHGTNFRPFIWKRRPHPVLCHPKLGPIDVMPDHAHEGLCVETADINANATYNFDGGPAEAEYPDAIDGGAKPLPKIIAYGSNLGSPPYNFVKLAQPARTNNPMISVYDGHRAGVGRVATDSTWHHWMDVNINNLQAADNDDWKKISRYFINLAVWLNPPGFSTSCLHLAVATSHFQYVGFQEYSPALTTVELGQVARAHLVGTYGPCWVNMAIFELVQVRKVWPFDPIREPRVRFDLGRVDPDLFEDFVLGQMVQATMKPADAVKEAVDAGKDGGFAVLAEPERLFEAPVRTGIADFGDALSESFNTLLKVAEPLRTR
jgi:hypothetical protein